MGGCRHRNADRLTSTTGSGAVAGASPVTDGLAGTELVYDAHGNTTTLADEVLGYDVADRHVSTVVAGGPTITYLRDLAGGIVQRTSTTDTVPAVKYTAGAVLSGTTGAILQRTLSLPGGVNVTIFPSGGKPQQHGYGYSLSYPIQYPALGSGNLVSGTGVWSRVLSTLSGTFPISGMGNNPSRGQTFILGGSNPVEVMNIGVRSITLKSLPGHAEGAGNYIVFEVSEDGTTFDVTAWGPKAVAFPVSLVPYAAWPLFASNVSSSINIGYNPWSGSWR